MKTIKIFVGVITHHHGADAHVAVSEDELYEKVANGYCTFMAETAADFAGMSRAKTAREKVRAYFDEHERDSLEIVETELELP